jgi:hypothetical protein
VTEYFFLFLFYFFFQKVTKIHHKKFTGLMGVKKIMKTAHPKTLYTLKKSNLSSCLFRRSTEINNNGAYVRG